MVDLAPKHKHGLMLANPVMTAAGILGFAREYRSLVDLARLGAFVTNALTFKPRTPANPPNAVQLTDSVLIHTGLPNPGVRQALRRWDKEWRRLGVPVILHLAATSPADTVHSLDLIEQAQGVAALELGLRDDVSAFETTQLVRAALGGPPLLVRLPMARAAELAGAAAQAGADALTIGAPPRLETVIEQQTVRGRLYGPGCLAQALEAVRAVAAQDLGRPIVGAGGIYSVEAARAMLDAGASALQVDAVVWTRPTIIEELRDVLSPVSPG
jgi:dihydroorotate dehydrogenase (NAD+) catalytic subunit